MNKLDTMNWLQRSAFGRSFFGNIRLGKGVATRLMLERIAKGGK